MALKLIFDKTKSHYTSAPWGKKGDDRWTVTIPAGYEYWSTVLTKLKSVNGGGARISEKPRRHQIGSGALEVHWWYDAFGKIRYRVRAYAKKIEGDAEPATVIKNSRTYSHYRNIGFVGSRGDDHIVVPIPSGYSFESVKLKYLDRTFGGARITSQPLQRSTGDLPFTVHWWYDPFGKVRYYLQVVAKKISAKELKIRTVTWTPRPAIAGRDVTFSVKARNTGDLTIDRVKVDAVVYAIDLDDTSLERLATQEQRTREVYNNTLTLNLRTGQEKTMSVTAAIPLTIPTPIGDLSTAGKYRLTISVRTTDNRSLDTWVNEDFRVVKR